MANLSFFFHVHIVRTVGPADFEYPRHIFLFPFFPQLMQATELLYYYYKQGAYTS